MLRINNLLLGGAAQNLRLVLAGSVTDVSTTVDFGFEQNDRLLIACLAWQASSVTLVSATIGGIAATIIKQAGATQGSAIIAAHVPTGLSGTVDVVMSGSAGFAGVTVYALYGRQTAGVAANDSASVASGTLTATLAVPANGIAIGTCCYNKNDTTTWTGLTLDNESHVLSVTQSTASKAFDAAQSALGITAVPGSAPSGKSLVCASWGP